MKEVQITQTPQVIDNSMFNNWLKCDIKAGNKKLELSFDFDEEEIQVGAYIENNQEAKIKGATTAAYTHAREVMRDISRQTGKPVCYMFISDVPIMVKWAEDVGIEVFEWDELDENNGNLIGTKRFYP